MKRFLILALLLALMVPVTAHAQGDSLVFAAVTEGSLYLYGEGEPQLIMDGADKIFFALVFSPDGSRLAFTVSGTESVQLYMTDFSGEPVLVAEGISDMPPAFSLDGSRLYYVVQASMDDAVIDEQGLMRLPMTIYGVGLDPMGAPEMAGEFLFGMGCGGGSSYPMDWSYSDEAGFMGNGSVFAAVDAGFVHNVDCTHHGVGFLNTGTGSTSVIASDFGRGQLSPGGTLMAGVQYGDSFPTVSNLALLDLVESFAATPLNTTVSPDQIGWGTEGVIFYSHREMREEGIAVDAEMAEAVRPLIFTEESVFPAYTSSIYRLDTNDGAETEFFSGDGWAIGRLFSAGDYLYFSLVPNVDVLLQAIEAGEIDPTGETAFDQMYALFTTDLYRVPLAGGEAELVADQVGKVTPRP